VLASSVVQVIVAVLEVMPDDTTAERVGGALSTVTPTTAEVAVLPAASRAWADKLCTPLATRVVSQEIVKGSLVTSARRVFPSSKNCTPTTPTLSDALAETVVLPMTVAPVAGAVIATVGGVV